MIVEPKVRGFICTTAHPEGCRENVLRQIEYAKAHPKQEGAKKALIIGSSTGYGLSSRIAAAYCGGAATLGVAFEKPASDSRTATAGWYNTAAFEQQAAKDGLYAKTLIGDAFSKEMKQEVIRTIQKDLGQVDLVVYSLAAPRRRIDDVTVYSSVLKTTGEPYTNKTIDLKDNSISEVTVPPATIEEIEATVKVMGGEDWMEWMEALSGAGVLAKNAKTVAYAYIGPAVTFPIYKEGSIGQAKQHLYDTAKQITRQFQDIGLQGLISVNKALVTQSSAAIPIVPLYISILYKVMKEQGLHEGCIEQMVRLYNDGLYGTAAQRDEEGRIRMDDLEMRPDVQKVVMAGWDTITNGNVEQVADIDGYWQDFYQMFGFHIPGVDYAADVEINVPIPSLAE